MLDRLVQAPPPLPRPSDLVRPDTAVFAWERLSAIAREVSPLFRRHWQEIALNQDSVPLDPDWDRYLAYELMGVLHVLTVRVDGVLVGYVFVFVGPHVHYATTTWAIVDMFWLDPTHRFGWTGIKMFRSLESKMRELGARVIHVAEKTHFANWQKRHVGLIFKRLGYREIERTWAKKLEG